MINRLKQYLNGGVADLLFERNFANQMEKEGYLKYISGDMSGCRYYELTDKGKELIEENK